MKVFWILLFGICIHPLSVEAAQCFMMGIPAINRRDYVPTSYCIIKISGKDNKCFLSYNSIEDDIGDDSSWGDRRCEIQKDGTGLCYCKEDECNRDILYFQDELREVLNMTKDDENLEVISNCIRQATNPVCAVGKPTEMVLAKRLGGNACSITLKKDGDTYTIVSVGQDANKFSVAYCEEYTETKELHCFCVENQCNIQNDIFSEGTSMWKDKDPLGTRAEPIDLFTSHVKTCGHSVAVFDRNGTQSCAKVFQKKENGTCTSEFAFVPNDENRTGCFARESEFGENAVACVCEVDECGANKHLEASKMRLDGDGCVQAFPTTTTSTSTTTTTTMATTTTTTTTPPEQLTCWVSDISTVTKDKTNSVCFIDYAMINSRCEMRGKGIVEDGNTTPGCRIVASAKSGDILRCTCVEDRCNDQLDGMWEKVESNNAERLELIKCVNRLVRGETLPTYGSSVTSLSQTEDLKSSNVSGLFIGSIAFNALLVVIILALIITVIKMKKKLGGAKQVTSKIEKVPKTPTAIQIEDPVVNKDSSTVATVASTTKADGITEPDCTATDGPPEIRESVRGFNRN